MTLRFRQSFTLFPGVRINVGKRGISTSIGVPGASLNIGRKGVRATVGAPGTGLSYSTMVLPFADEVRRQPAPQLASLQANPPENPRPAPRPATANTPATASLYMPQEGMNEIASASVEVLTSSSLIPLRDMIAKAREQKVQVSADLAEARDEASKLHKELGRRKGSLFRWFYRHRIAELEAELPVVAAEVERLASWQQNTSIAVAFEAGEAAQRAYAAVVRSFEVLRACSKIWDITAAVATSQATERTIASRSVNRQEVTFDFAENDLIQFSGRPMRLQNINGDDILLFPGVAVIPRVDGVFALIDIRELSIKFARTRFQEAEFVPPDSMVIGQTWHKTNKDGSPDRRFKGNFEIPICQYGKISLSSKTGLTEEFMVSDVKAAEVFSASMNEYKSALTAASD